MTSQQNTKESLIPFDPKNSWALNMVSANYAKVCSNINNTLQNLINELNASVGSAAKALYEQAAATFKAGICEAVGNMMAGASTVYAGFEANNVSKKLDTSDQELTQKETEANNNLKKTTDESRKTELQKSLNNYAAQKKKNSELKQHTQHQAQMKQWAYQNIVKAPQELQKGYYDSIKVKEQGIQGIMQAINDNVKGTHDQVLSTLRAFLEPRYLAGIVTLANIMIR